jgi:putative membrane protein
MPRLSNDRSWSRRSAWLVLALLPLAGCNQAPPRVNKAADTASANVEAAVQAQMNPTLSTTDSLFIDQAARAGLAEVREGQYVAQKAPRASVRHFAETMVKDHGMVNDDLMALAARKQISAPKSPNDAQQQELGQLQGLHGAALDRAYLNDQFAAHQAVLKLFQTEAQQGTDPDVKAFAAQYAPTIAHHLDMVTRLGGHMPTS